MAEVPTGLSGQTLRLRGLTPRQPFCPTPQPHCLSIPHSCSSTGASGGLSWCFAQPPMRLGLPGGLAVRPAGRVRLPNFCPAQR